MRNVRTYVYALFDLNDYIRVKDEDKECFGVCGEGKASSSACGQQLQLIERNINPFLHLNIFFSVYAIVYIQVIKEPSPHHMCMWAPGRCVAIQHIQHIQPIIILKNVSSRDAPKFNFKQIPLPGSIPSHVIFIIYRCIAQ